MIEIKVWVFILLIATNFITVMFAMFLVYFIAGILDLTYFERHKAKPNKDEKKCPYKVEDKDDEIRR